MSELLSRMFAHSRGRSDQRGVAACRIKLELARQIRVIHQLECISDRQSRGQHSMTAQDQHVLIAEILDQSLLLIEIERDAFVTVIGNPPVDEANQPDLVLLEAASTMIGRVLKKGDVVIYESTVYPGTTQEKCVPLRMGIYVANQVMRLMAHKRIDIVDSHILVLGLTVKEDCPDLRNTKVIDIVRELTQYHAHVDVHDPWADPDETRMKFGIGLIEEPKTGAYDAVILAVPHETFTSGVIQIRVYGKSRSLLFDAKGVLDPRLVDGRI